MAYHWPWISPQPKLKKLQKREYSVHQLLTNSWPVVNQEMSAGHNVHNNTTGLLHGHTVTYKLRAWMISQKNDCFIKQFTPLLLIVIYSHMDFLPWTKCMADIFLLHVNSWWKTGRQECQEALLLSHLWMLKQVMLWEFQSEKWLSLSKWSQASIRERLVWPNL